MVGKNRRSELVQRGGKAYIELQGVPFEVLGVMGPEEETAFDSTVLINGLAEPELFRDILYRLDFSGLTGSSGRMPLPPKCRPIMGRRQRRSRSPLPLCRV